MDLSQNSSFVNAFNQSGTNFQTGSQTPPSLSTDGAKKPNILKIFLIFIILILIIGGVFVFLNKDSIFQSKWSKEINAWDQKYNVDSDIFLKEFETIDMGMVIDQASAEKVKASLKLSKQYLNEVDRDIQSALQYLSLDSEVQQLSSEDKSVKEDYKICYEGRKKAIDILSLGIVNSLYYMEAFDYMQKYETEIGNFIKLKNEAGVITRQKDDQASIDILTKERDSSLFIKDHLDKLFVIFKYDSFKIQSTAYQTLASGLSDMITAFGRKDVALLNKGTSKVAEAGKMIESVRGQMAVDKQKWFDENVTAKYMMGNAELDKVQSFCYKAEQATKN